MTKKKTMDFIVGVYVSIFYIFALSIFYSTYCTMLFYLIFYQTTLQGLFQFFPLLVLIFFVGLLLFLLCRHRRQTATKEQKRLLRKQKKTKSNSTRIENETFLHYWMKIPFQITSALLKFWNQNPYFPSLLLEYFVHYLYTICCENFILICLIPSLILISIFIFFLWRFLLIFILIYFNVLKIIEISRIEVPIPNVFFDIIIKLQIIDILMTINSSIDLEELFQILEKSFEEKYDDKIYPYLFQNFDRIIREHSHIFHLTKLNDETTYINYINPITLHVEIMRMNSDCLFSSPFSLHPSLTIDELLQIIFKNFGENYNTIRLKKYNLLDLDLQKKSLFELGIQEDSKIILFPSTYRSQGGGAGEGPKVKQCPSCENVFDYRDVCDHDNCSNCRKLDPPPCKCCYHNRKGGRCDHGWCWKKCVYVRHRKSKCDCHLNFPNHKPIDRRDRSDYNFRRSTIEKKVSYNENIEPSDLIKNTPLHKEFSEVSKYRSYPINDYGTREEYCTLSNHQWLTFQCLLFFRNCEDKNLTPKASTTYLFFIKNYNLQEHFSMEDVERVLMLYLTNQISINNFRMGLMSDLEISRGDSFKDLVNRLILTFHEYPELDLVQFFEKINSEINETTPGLLINSPMDEGMLEMSVGCLISISEYIKKLDTDFGSKRSRSNLIHTCTVPLIYHNPYYKNDKDLQKFIKISNHLLHKAKENVVEYKTGVSQTFERQYKTRQIFDLNSDCLARTFWQIATEPCDGKQSSSKQIGPNEVQKIPIRYIPCSVDEFYIKFCQHSDFGKKCQTVKGQMRVPSKWWFNQRRPHNIRPMRSFRTGMCPECMEARQYLLKFRQMMRKNCKCKSLNCSNFTHLINICSGLFSQDGTCQTCTECSCSSCSECKIDTITKSLFEFLKFSKCCVEKHGGYDFPSISCVHHLKTKKCEKCKIETFEDLVNLYGCKSILNNIDFREKIFSKRWTKVEISTPYTKKQKFDVHVMENVKVSQKKFIQDFIELFFTKKRNFAWHYTCTHFQNFVHNEMINNYVKGVYEEFTNMFLCDWSEDYNMKNGPSIANKQHYLTRPCQILSIIDFEFYKNKFSCASHFFLSNKNVKKNTKTSLRELQELIRDKMNKKKVNVIHIWSDGSTKEFMNCNVFGNVGKISKAFGIKIIWHFFLNNHGKNICDTEFSRLKTKLDYLILTGQIDSYDTVAKLFFVCENYVQLKEAWKWNGKITERKFHHRIRNPSWTIFKNKRFQIFKTCTDTKLYRSHGFDEEGKYYRRYNSCPCKNCVLNPNFFDNSDCLLKSALSGKWKPYTPKLDKTLKKKKKKTKPKMKSCCNGCDSDAEGIIPS